MQYVTLLLAWALAHVGYTAFGAGFVGGGIFSWFVFYFRRLQLRSAQLERVEDRVLSRHG